MRYARDSVLLLLGELLLRFGFFLLLLVDTLPHFLWQFLVAREAIRIGFYFFHILACESRFATSAGEARRMECFSEERERARCRCLVAFEATISCDLEEVKIAVRIAAVLTVAGIGEWLFACEADKVFRMPHFAHGCDRTTDDWFVTTTACLAQELQIVVVTVQLAFVFVTVTALECSAALKCKKPVFV
jgi:hypothetical protein